MAVYRERSGNYCYDFWWREHRIKESTRQKNKAVARQMEAARKTDLARGEVGLEKRKPVPEFRNFVEQEFLPWFKATHQEHPRTHRRHHVSTQPLLRFFTGWQLTEIDAGSVEQYKQSRITQTSAVTGRKLRPATVNRELAALRAMFNLAIKHGLMKTNPVRGLRFLPENNEQTRVLSFAEESRYLTAANERLREVATLILSTGMRPEEVYRLRREDVHLAEGYVHIPYGKTRAARRNIPLNRDARTVLARALDRLGSVYVLSSKLDPNRPMGTIANTHGRTVKGVGVPWFRLYDLRHTFATRAVQSGMDLPTLARILGHSKLNMVLRYAHPTPEHQRLAMDRLEQYVSVQQAESHAGTHAQQGWMQ